MYSNLSITIELGTFCHLFGSCTLHWPLYFVGQFFLLSRSNDMNKTIQVFHDACVQWPDILQKNQRRVAGARLTVDYLLQVELTINRVNTYVNHRWRYHHGRCFIAEVCEPYKGWHRNAGKSMLQYLGLNDGSWRSLALDRILTTFWGCIVFSASQGRVGKLNYPKVWHELTEMKVDGGCDEKNHCGGALHDASCLVWRFDHSQE